MKLSRGGGFRNGRDTVVKGRAYTGQGICINMPFRVSAPDVPHSASIVKDYVD